MHLKLDLEQDAELRLSIKKLIDQQVKSIVREQFNEIIEEEIKKKLNTLTQNFNNNRWMAMIQTSCDKYTDNILRENGVFKFGGFSEDITKNIMQVISVKLDDRRFNELVTKTANEKLKQLINQ
jgi:ribosomal protein S3AE